MGRTLLCSHFREQKLSHREVTQLKGGGARIQTAVLVLNPCACQAFVISFSGRALFSSNKNIHGVLQPHMKLVIVKFS